VLRERFPGLADGAARLDGPAGTQMVDVAIDAMADWMRSGHGANEGGAFPAAERTDGLVEGARAAVARLLGADPDTVAFGPNMTALTMRFAATAGRELETGDEVVCTRLDHDANVAPWLIAAQRARANVRFAEPDPVTLELPVSAVEDVLSERTRWVAVTAASNAVGTVPDVAGIVAAARRVWASVHVDAVHAAPHRELDLRALGVDSLCCSAYKWYGPHVGVLAARPDLLAQLQPDKLRPSSDGVPERWELGTLPFESLAGVRAAADFMLEVDRHELRAHEDRMLQSMLEGLGAINGVTLHGGARDRTPTVMFSVAGRSPREVAAALGSQGVYVWHGNYYALELARFLGLEPDGALRAGAVLYNDGEDVARLVSAVERIAAGLPAASAR
jgi:cysteine desulfurase family protein (TIGR01976 family)